MGLIEMWEQYVKRDEEIRNSMEFKEEELLKKVLSIYLGKNVTLEDATKVELIKSISTKNYAVLYEGIFLGTVKFRHDIAPSDMDRKIPIGLYFDPSEYYLSKTKSNTQYI